MPGNLNRPFPSSLVPLFKASLSAKPFLWKWLWFAWKWNCLQNSFSRCHMKDLHLDSFWNRGTRELENSLFYIYREDLLIDVVNTRQALSRFFTLNYSSKRRQNDFVIFLHLSCTEHLITPHECVPYHMSWQGGTESAFNSLGKTMIFLYSLYLGWP